MMRRAFCAFWLVLLAGMAIGVAAPAFAVGFMVKPLRMEVAPFPGRTVSVPLEVRNVFGADVGTVNFHLVELTQGHDGSWQLIEPDSGKDTSGLASALAWTRLDKDSVKIEPLQPATVNVQVTPPPSARGAYFVGIIAETPVPENPQGIVIRVRFLVPVIVEIQGRPVRQQVTLDDLPMRYEPAGAKPATTFAGLEIVNRGRTYSRVRGQLRVELQTNGRWRLVTAVDIKELSIIPGVKLQLMNDLQRRLPSGSYRLRGELFVDGRRVKPLEKVIDFAGDPNASKLAYDTALLLSPKTVEMNVVPGATRTAILSIENPGTDPVKVDMRATTPRGLVGVAMGELKGSELSAEPWTQIRPSNFTIRAGSRQNVRVSSSVPAAGVDHAHYYADLTLSGTYPDGQSAGSTFSTIDLVNSEVPSDPKGVVDKLSLAEGAGPTSYVVDSRLVNIGNVAVTPTATAQLLKPQGGQVLSVALDGDTDPLLPMGKRTFGGEMDFKGLDQGLYTLRVTCVLADGVKVTDHRVVKVEASETVAADGTKQTVQQVVVLDPSVEAATADPSSIAGPTKTDKEVQGEGQ